MLDPVKNRSTNSPATVSRRGRNGNGNWPGPHVKGDAPLAGRDIDNRRREKETLTGVFR
jgi:hypothetical protein